MEGTDCTKFAQDQRLVGSQLAAGVQLMANDKEKDGEYFIVTKSEGKVSFERRTPRPAARAHMAASIASLISMTAYFATARAVVLNSDKFAAEAAGAPAPKQQRSSSPTDKFVFVNEQGIEVLLNQTDRREGLSFEFEKSDSLRAIESLQTVHTFNQRDFIDFLRRKVNAEMTPADIIERLRKVKFSSSVAGESTIQTGKESISRAVQQQLTGTVDFPEEIMFSVPYFDNVRDSDGNLYMVSIACALDIDLQNQTFTLRPIAGELAGASDFVLRSIQQQLAEELEDKYIDVRVFLGWPETAPL